MRHHHHRVSHRPRIHCALCSDLKDWPRIPTAPSRPSITSRESAAAVAVAMVNLGKLLQDLLLWSTREFGFLRLPDAFVQSSSIMPQKRNPVALEHARILASRALGQAQALLTCAHNTPFGDINDSEDDLQPLVFTMFESALRSTRLLGRSDASSRDRHGQARRTRRRGFLDGHRIGGHAGTVDRDEFPASAFVGRAGCEAPAVPTILPPRSRALQFRWIQTWRITRLK